MSAKITFSNQLKNLDGLCDALTGASLDKSLGLYRCEHCLVFYHLESYKAIQTHNNGLCSACGLSNIREAQPE